MTPSYALAHRPSRIRLLLIVGAALGLLLLLPVTLGSYHTALASEVLIFAIFAMSLDLVLGYTGLVSFGHAACFGIGAYVVLISSMTFGVHPWLAWAIGTVGAGLAATAVGWFSTLVGGIPFLMVTMAFAQLVYSVAVRWRDVTGGSDGLGGMGRPFLGSISLEDPAAMYYFALACCVGAFLVMRRVVKSSLGHTFVGIRENESRMQAIGYPTRFYQRVSFAISGMIAGFAGGLYALFNGFISPDALHWTASGDVLIMVVLGGVGTLVGPVLGTAIFLILKNVVSSLTDYWMLVIGALFVLSVLFLRRGLYGLFVRERQA